MTHYSGGNSISDMFSSNALIYKQPFSPNTVKNCCV